MKNDRKLSYSRYFNKVLGGWIGKGLGGTVGIFEGPKRITHFKIEELLPDSMLANDDLDIQLVWLDVLLEKGIHFTSSDLMQAWLDEYDFNFGEYAIGRRNYNRGIKPPFSGVYANDYYKTGMGCPIRSEVWGMGCPGDPALAAQYAHKDGILDHEGDSVWAEQFLAAVEAEAFFENDFLKLIETGLSYIPKSSMVYNCIFDAKALYLNGYTWQAAWEKLKNMHSHPDCSYSPFNLGIIALALLYGQGNIVKTLSIAVNCGWDVDCTCASSTSIIGIICGADGFERKWIDLLGDKVSTFARPVNDMSTLKKITEYTCRFGATLYKEGLLDIGLTEIPSDISYLPTAYRYGEISLSVDYMGQPAVGAYNSKDISVVITNHSSYDISGILTLKLPKEICSDKNEISCRLSANAQIKEVFTLNVSPDVNILPDKNMITAEFITENRCFKETFGICGAPSTLAIGPFFDNYDDWLKEENLPEYRFLTTKSDSVIIPMTGEEWGNHRVDIEKLYCNEEAIVNDAQSLFTSSVGTPCSVFADIYDIKNAFTLHGPCCVYFYEAVVSPDSRKALLFLGSDSPYKFWLNGKCISQQSDSRFWFCNNNVLEVELNEGENRIVLKIARTGKDNKFSMNFRKVTDLGGYDAHPIMTDLKYKIFR